MLNAHINICAIVTGLRFGTDVCALKINGVCILSPAAMHTGVTKITLSSVDSSDQMASWFDISGSQVLTFNAVPKSLWATALLFSFIFNKLC